MKKIHVFYRTSTVLLSLIAAACGGSGGESSTTSNSTTSTSSTSNSTTNTSSSSNTSNSTTSTSSSSNTSNTSTNTTPTLLSNPNPLNLSPAPQFTSSTRSVVYDDCFPKYDDVLVGDNLVIDAQTSLLGQVYAYKETYSVQQVTPVTIMGRSGISVLMTSPPVTITTSSFPITKDQMTLTNISLKGSNWTDLLETFSTTNALLNSSTTTPTTLGDISAGRTSSPYKLGDSETSTFSTARTNNTPPSPSSSNTTESVTTTFIGVEEGTQVTGGSFPYTCVFRVKINGEVDSDIYTHKWGQAKKLRYSFGNSVPRVNQMASDTAYTRRKANSP